jgi:protein-S-isoprenylcysteine O-methyltransferase Ste14
VLVYLPTRVLSVGGVTRPARLDAPQVTGMIVGGAGAALAIWCILTFAFLGRGTPAPFDPPRRLVVRGPYRFVRNPMYLGAGLALAGAAVFYETVVLWAYAAGFLLVMHLVVVAYEEPTLRRTFGEDYEKYCRQVRRWLPAP